MSPSPLASIIICTWDGLDVLPECLESLWEQTCANFEVIVVDNGSRDGTAEYLAGLAEARLRVVPLPENRGFAGGNNAGLRVARGAYVVFVNNDTVAEPAWLESLIAPLRGRPDVGMAACRLVDYYDRTRLDAVGHLFYPDGLNRGRGRFEPNPGPYTRIEEIFFPPGCGCAYRRQVVEALGGFDERFFAYGDDTELGLRARWAGWTCLYVPDAVMYHKISRTSGWYSEFKAFQVERNRIWIAIKYLPVLRLVASPFFTLCRFALQGYGALTGRGAAGRFAESASGLALLRVLARAHIAALAQAGSMWDARRWVMDTRALSSREFGKLMARYRIGLVELALKD